MDLPVLGDAWDLVGLADLIAVEQGLSGQRLVGGHHGRQMLPHPDHDPPDADFAAVGQHAMEQGIGALAAVTRAQIVEAVEVLRVDLSDVGESEQLDRVGGGQGQREGRAKARATGRKKMKVTVGGHTIELSHMDNVLFPSDGITEGDLADYYRRIAGRMLSYVKDRPVIRGAGEERRAHRHADLLGRGRPAVIEADPLHGEESHRSAVWAARPLGRILAPRPEPARLPQETDGIARRAVGVTDTDPLRRACLVDPCSVVCEY